jgi:hypothetical protein
MTTKYQAVGLPTNRELNWAATPRQRRRPYPAFYPVMCAAPHIWRPIKAVKQPPTSGRSSLIAGLWSNQLIGALSFL